MLRVSLRHATTQTPRPLLPHRQPHLIEAEIPRLRRYARALARDPALADDLVQDCLERALGAWNQRRPDGSLKAWLFAILHNTWRNRLRREAIRPDNAVLEDDEAGPQASGGQWERLEIRDLEAALARMPEEQRALLLLIAVEGLSYGEAAQVQGVPLGTVMSRLTRARDRLHRLLEGDQGSGPERPRLRRVK